ncbi:T9SS type A sorting domain-containing protein [Faecalibacter sp. LW9]|uniref:T9SS type A sorting domain-containing protein n=1 Tax=Faecalibacter sp. LW9 TaxID=3103144 RepID=UPI002AFFEE67|nr:T9SS type A sorting domain-containing protein [Faecalibacter sp. LW9]
MKKIFTLLSVAAFSVAFGQYGNLEKVQVIEGLPQAETQTPVNGLTNTEHTLVQYTDTPSLDSTPLCADAINHNSRFFNLANYGITSDFTVTAVNFSTSSTGITMWAEVATVPPGTDITAAEITDLNVTDAYGSVTVPMQENSWVNMELLETTVIPAGTDFGVAIGYEWVTNGPRAWFGNNEDPQTAPSFIGWPGSTCVAAYPVDLTSLEFNSSWLLNVVGTTESLGTVELGSNKLAVYPNPATTELQVKLEGTSIASVEIADVTGRVVSAQSVKNGKVNVSNLSQGVYFLRVKDDKGVTRIQKFIKK